MKLFTAIAAFLLATAAAQAQQTIGLYVAPQFTRIGNTADTGTFAFLGDGKSSNWFEGASIGGYYDFAGSPVNSFGMDIRDTILHGDNAPLNEFLLGVHYARHNKGSRFSPMAELLGGVGSTEAQHNPHKVSKPMYQVSAGVDYSLGKYADWRMVEVGYAGLHTIGSDTFDGGANPRPSANIISFQTGIVFRIR